MIEVIKEIFMILGMGIELKEINGVPSLVIPVNGELKINGMEVELK